MITPTPRGIVCEGYCNHGHPVTDQWGNVYAVFTHGKPESLKVRRRQHGGNGDWTTIAEFPATKEHKYGYASLAIVGAHLVVLAPERQPDGTTPVREFLLIGAITEFPPVVPT